MDHLFGKKYKSETLAFSLYGVFDKQNDILFHDGTEALYSTHELKRDDAKRNMEFIYDRYLSQYYTAKDDVDYNAGNLSSDSSLCFVLLLAVVALLLKQQH